MGLIFRKRTFGTPGFAFPKDTIFSEYSSSEKASANQVVYTLFASHLSLQARRKYQAGK
jgi:nitrous oxidase accessory protein NosD